MPIRPALARRSLAAGLALGVIPATASASGDGLVTLRSAHGPRQTLDRFAAAVREAGWKVFGEIDHAAAATEAGMALPARTVVLFGNPRAGTPGMRQAPTLALDLPMRALVWQDEAGTTFLTRSDAEDIARRVFYRHGITIDAAGRRATETLLAGFARRATAA